jgi:hypothetical protein
MEMTSASAGSSMRACVHVLVMDRRRSFPHVTRFSAAKKRRVLFSAVCGLVACRAACALTLHACPHYALSATSLRAHHFQKYH